MFPDLSSIVESIVQRNVRHVQLRADAEEFVDTIRGKGYFPGRTAHVQAIYDVLLWVEDIRW